MCLFYLANEPKFDFFCDIYSFKGILELNRILSDFTSKISEKDLLYNPNGSTYIYNDEILISDTSELESSSKLQKIEDQSLFFSDLLSQIRFVKSLDIFTKHHLLAPPSKYNENFKKIDLDESELERVDYKKEQLFNKPIETINYNKEIIPMKISNKLSLALGMKSNKFPPPFFNRFNENGVPNYYKNKGQKIIGINEYLPDDYDDKIWKKTNIDKEFLKRKKRKIVEKNESPIDNEEIEKEINKHIRKAVPIYEDIIENIID